MSPLHARIAGSFDRQQLLATLGARLVRIEVSLKPSGRVLKYKLTNSFRDKIRAIAPTDFPEAAKQLDALADADIFTIAESEKK